MGHFQYINVEDIESLAIFRETNNRKIFCVFLKVAYFVGRHIFEPLRSLTRHRSVRSKKVGVCTKQKAQNTTVIGHPRLQIFINYVIVCIFQNQKASCIAVRLFPIEIFTSKESSVPQNRFWCQILWFRNARFANRPSSILGSRIPGSLGILRLSFYNKKYGCTALTFT